MVSEQLEPVRPELSERGDIIKAINRALTERDEERVHCIYVLHGDEAPTPIVGRVIGKRLTDEFGEPSASSLTASMASMATSITSRPAKRWPLTRRRSARSWRSTVPLTTSGGPQHRDRRPWHERV